MSRPGCISLARPGTTTNGIRRSHRMTATAQASQSETSDTSQATKCDTSQRVGGKTFGAVANEIDQA